MNFYLDDYSLIRVKENERLLNRCLKVFCDRNEIKFDLKDEGEYLSLLLDYEYKDNDDLYVLLDDKRYELRPRFISQSTKFDIDFKVDLNLLGSFIEGDKTIFRLWSPLSKCAYVIIDNLEYKMNYCGKGLYELVVDGNLDKSLYHYKVVREKVYEFTDPFSYTDQDDNSYVIDVNKFNFDKITPESKNDTVIYEINVRDFSSGDNLPFKYPKKLLALSEEGLKLNGQSIGLDYLCELNISHLQIMPIFSYDYDKSDYNWGYNPTSYNTIHKDYLISEDPYGQVEEVRSVINKLHSRNIKVNLDVVFNHVYKAHYFSLDKMLPYYFFRYKNGKIGNASYCGNEMRSESYFFNEYIKLLVKRYIDLYDIDGLRFDLMGILDYQTINEVNEICKWKKNDFMVYGEGWNMGNILNEESRATIQNAYKMKDIAFFNNYFRENIRGKNFKDSKSFLFGGGLFKEEAKKVLSGSYDYGFDYRQSINYVECHDNYTMFDKTLALDNKYCKELSKLAMGLTLLSRGIPFIHSGQEFLRTKDNIDNTYNMSDFVNKLDWYRKNGNLDVVGYLKDLVKLRLDHSEFYEPNVIINFDDYYECLIFKINALNIFINPCVFDHIYKSDDNYEVIYDENGFVDYTSNAFKIRAFSILLAYKKQ